ncbi:Chain length determinant protein [uncultured archaeon]|nr:Chain length determinant protein [uncultured archaeon]
MEEDEISLRDYINVILKEKILIASIFLVAIIAAAIFSFSIPKEYSSEAKLSYISNDKIPLTDAVEMLQSQTIIQKVASQESGVSQGDALSMLDNLKIGNVKDTNQILLQVKGNNPDTMKRYFERYVNVAIDEVNRISARKSQSDYSRLENLSTVYTKQRDEVSTEMNRKLIEAADLELRRLENLTDITARLGSRDRQLDLAFRISDLEEIKNGRTSSSAAQQMISSNPELSLLNSKLSSIDARLVDLDTKKLELENLDTVTVKLISPPTDPVMTGPRRTLNIAIAAVLGLFIGVFAAFFKNYMEESASK